MREGQQGHGCEVPRVVESTNDTNRGYNPGVLEISYQLTIDDYRQGFKAMRRRTTFSRWSSRFTYSCFFLVLAAAIFLSLLGPDKSFSNLFPLWALVAFLTCVIWYSPYRIARKMIKGSPSASLPHTMEISESGIYSRSAIGESRFTWDLIVGWVEVDRVFALFPSPVSFFPIPKRAMSADQQTDLRGLLQARVSPRK